MNYPYPLAIKFSLIQNSIITPDGTTLFSRSRHDFVSHADKNGKNYAVDGGLCYVRRIGDRDWKDNSVVLGTVPPEEAVKIAVWGSYGKDGKQPLRYIPIASMETEHLRAVLGSRPDQINPAIRYLMHWEVSRRRLSQIVSPDRAIIICGKPRHGKDTFGDYLATCTGLLKGSTSSIVYDALAEELGADVETLLSGDKEELRPKLVAKGNALCAENPTYLVDTLWQRGCRIIVGVRRVAEITATRYPCDVVWVNRVDGPEVLDNTEMGLRDMASTVFDFPEGDLDGILTKAINYAKQEQLIW